jgi:hypothetical protein
MLPSRLVSSPQLSRWTRSSEGPHDERSRSHSPRFQYGGATNRRLIHRRSIRSHSGRTPTDPQHDSPLNHPRRLATAARRRSASQQLLTDPRGSAPVGASFSITLCCICILICHTIHIGLVEPSIQNNSFNLMFNVNVHPRRLG